MKKYFLTALLGVFCLFGFASADTVGDFTSDSEISYSNFINSSELGYDLITGDFYFCISSSDFPYYVKNGGMSSSVYVNSSVYCSSSQVNYSDEGLYIYNVAEPVDSNDIKEISGTVYISSSVITYTNSTQGSGGGSSSSGILIGGTSAFNGIITSISNTISEFIPYVVYIGLGILGSVIGFSAIRWLVNYVKYKILGIFSSRRRR